MSVRETLTRGRLRASCDETGSLFQTSPVPPPARPFRQYARHRGRSDGPSCCNGRQCGHVGRGYVARRLQQACDAGTLAARKRLGSDLPPSGHVLGQVRKTGKSFFDLNFPEGRYDTTELSFVMTLEEDFAITGAASANLPTAVMGIFGKNNIPITVSCGSRMNFSNLDIMLVLDTTGSMRHTNSGDTSRASIPCAA